MERSYKKLLFAFVKDLHAYTMREFGKEFVQAKQDDFRMDAQAEIVSRKLRKVIRDYRPSAQIEITPEKIQRIADGLAITTRRGFEERLRQALGFDFFKESSLLDSIARDFVHDNVQLITSLQDRYFEDIQKVVDNGVRAGVRAETVAKDLRERLGVSESRAQLIARDQISKLNGNIVQARQQGLGIEKYIWRTSQDERVREEHEILEGQTFTWAEGSPEGNPGEPINCRCGAEPVLDDLIES